MLGGRENKKEGWERQIDTEKGRERKEEEWIAAFTQYLDSLTDGKSIAKVFIFALASIIQNNMVITLLGTWWTNVCPGSCFCRFDCILWYLFIGFFLIF